MKTNKANVIITNWDQSRRPQWPASRGEKLSQVIRSCNGSDKQRFNHELHSENDKSLSSSSTSCSSSSLGEIAQAVADNNAKDFPLQLDSSAVDGYYFPDGVGYERLLISQARDGGDKVRGPSGSVRGSRDFVRRSAQNIHKLNEMSISDGLIYVNSSSLLSRKILEQEQDDEEDGGDDDDNNDCDSVGGDANIQEEGEEKQVAGCDNNDHHHHSYPRKKMRELTTFAKHSSSLKTRTRTRRQLICQDLISSRKRQALRALYLSRLALGERDRCVLYTTSLSVVRRTFEDSKHMRNILALNLIRFEERDVYLNREYKIQLRLRLVEMARQRLDDNNNNNNNNDNDSDRDKQLDAKFAKTSAGMSNLSLSPSSPSPSPNSSSSSSSSSKSASSAAAAKPTSLSSHLPCLFIEGRLFCKLKDLELLNETSQLSKVFARFKMSKYSSEVCGCCGNARFIACPSCNGSRRSLVRHFRLSSVALKCTRCDNNDGLVACPACRGDSEILLEEEAEQVQDTN